jgi:hypothetical protein
MLDNMLGLVIRKAGLKIEGLANRENMERVDYNV